MTKIEEYKLLNKKVRDARRDLRDAMETVTQNFKEYVLDKDVKNPGSACINRFDSVSAKTLSAGILDDNVKVAYCDSFNCHHLCENNDCPYEEKNWDAVAAQFAYDNARQERRAFVRNLFKGRGK